MFLVSKLFKSTLFQVYSNRFPSPLHQCNHQCTAVQSENERFPFVFSSLFYRFSFPSHDISQRENLEKREDLPNREELILQTSRLFQNVYRILYRHILRWISYLNKLCKYIFKKEHYMPQCSVSQRLKAHAFLNPLGLLSEQRLVLHRQRIVE